MASTAISCSAYAKPDRDILHNSVAGDRRHNWCRSTVANGFTANTVVSETGGAGGATTGNTTASGGAGASTDIANAGTTTPNAAGNDYQTQKAVGSVGGAGYGAVGGTAGSATSSLTFTSAAALVVGSSYATGGVGGAGRGTTNGAAGGTGTASSYVTGGGNNVTARAHAY